MKKYIKSDRNQNNQRLQELLDIVDDAFQVQASVTASAETYSDGIPVFSSEAVMGEAGARNIIRLTSIPGVKRNQAKDFKDDGAYFSAYIYKDLVPITYTRSDGIVYIAMEHPPELNFDEASQLPSYPFWYKFNGVPAAEFDPQMFATMLEEAYNDFTEAINNVGGVDPAALDERIALINQASAAYYQKVQAYLKDRASEILNLSEFGFKSLKGYVKAAGSATADYIRDASEPSKRRFMKEDIEKLQRQISNEWNFKYIEELFNKQ